jgi:hypothetical protein
MSVKPCFLKLTKMVDEVCGFPFIGRVILSTASGLGYRRNERVWPRAKLAELMSLNKSVLLVLLGVFGSIVSEVECRGAMRFRSSACPTSGPTVPGKRIKKKFFPLYILQPVPNATRTYRCTSLS